ncbi:hypothetical protein WH47_04114 [Habropoda laboriosa]|uniref:Uncharacterized protein n=1 Tax=Habropoda laboriosa TaxID=597456 RepID=A0A0L7QV65_9HYME|nr:hypothetical protein WH47_04114 [Habropoda laboriosa]
MQFNFYRMQLRYIDEIIDFLEFSRFGRCGAVLTCIIFLESLLIFVHNELHLKQSLTRLCGYRGKSY